MAFLTHYKNIYIIDFWRNMQDERDTFYNNAFKESKGMNSLRNKTALVTGGGSGIGKAIVEELAEQGARVFIHYHTSRTPAEELSERIKNNGGTAWVLRADLTSEDEVKSLAESLSDKTEQLDILVNNAGTFHERTQLEEVTVEFWRGVTALNLDSMFMIIREVVPLMKNIGEASIVNVSSEAGRKGGNAGSLAYSTVKGAILTMTRGLATELAPHGIRVNAVAPGMVLGTRIHAARTSSTLREQIIARTPVGRAGTCEDVARAVAYLASEYNGFITGATLDINGGVYMV
jgi:3-oxoacyl-[acyl-carrier protein] reductase